MRSTILNRRAPILLMLLPFLGCGGTVADNSGGSTGIAGSAGNAAAGTAGTVAGGADSGGSPTSGGVAQGGTTNWNACNVAQDCVLEPKSPCGVGCEPIAITAYVAVNQASVAAYQASLPKLACPQAVCGPVAPFELTAPNYFADCVQGQCSVIDLRTTDYTACSSIADCYIRSGTTCCGCSSGSWIALSNKASVETLFCGPSVACTADCAVVTQPPIKAICAMNGHCAVTSLVLP